MTANNIHPTRKGPSASVSPSPQEPSAYGEKIEYSGPIYQDDDSKDRETSSHFTHDGSGSSRKTTSSKASPSPESDGKFLPATAMIHGDTVIVTSDKVARPAAVRYGWAMLPEETSSTTKTFPPPPFARIAPDTSR